MGKSQLRYNGSFDELPADTLIIDVEETPTRVGNFAAFLRGDPPTQLCIHASPFTESALILLEQGYDPERDIAMVHKGRDFYAMRGKLGAVADIARARKRDGGGNAAS